MDFSFSKIYVEKSADHQLTYYIRIFEIVQETTFCAATFRRIFFQLPIILKKLSLKKSGPAGLDLSKNAFKKTKKNLKNKPRGFPRKQVILS